MQSSKPCELNRSGAEDSRQLVVEPFLHFGAAQIYNPLTDRSLNEQSSLFRLLKQLAANPADVEKASYDLLSSLESEGWLVPNCDNLGRRFRLKYALIEGASSCNQGCYFCPVSEIPREVNEMPLELYETIAEQLCEFEDTLEGVFMDHYNEPTSDPRFLDRVKILLKHGLKPAMNSNGTGLTKKRVDDLVDLGGLRYMSINLSTIDKDKYARDRGADHLELVLRNLEYAKNRRVAQDMRIAVIGSFDDQHKREIARITEIFEGSYFEVRPFEIMNRAGHVSIGSKPLPFQSKLRGCQNVGDRVSQWLHVNFRGQAVLCCQDYGAQHVVGDLSKQRVSEVLKSEAFAKIRRWSYSLEESPGDFLCNGCVFARRG